MEELKRVFKDENYIVQAEKEEKIDLECFLSKIYTINEMAFFLKHRKSDYDEYKKSCQKSEINFVERDDCEKIIDSVEFYNEIIAEYHYPKVHVKKDLSYILNLKSKDDIQNNTKINIAVPLSISSTINILNVRDFIKKKIVKQYEMSEILSAPDNIVFNYKIDQMQLKIYVYNDASQFTEEDWLDTACIFVDGEKWQFNDWKVKDIARTFASIPTFFVHSSKNIPSWLKEYNIKEINTNSKNFGKLDFIKKIQNKINEIIVKKQKL